VTLNKAIGYFLLNEDRKVMIDLEMQNGRVLYFDKEAARFIEKAEAIKDNFCDIVNDTQS